MVGIVRISVKWEILSSCYGSFSSNHAHWVLGHFASGHNQNRSDNYNQTVTEKVQLHIELDFSGQTWCRFSLSIQAGEKCWCKRRMPSLGRKEQKGPIREKRQERPNQQFSTFLKQGCSDDAQQQLWNFFSRWRKTSSQHLAKYKALLFHCKGLSTGNTFMNVNRGFTWRSKPVVTLKHGYTKEVSCF